MLVGIGTFAGLFAKPAQAGCLALVDFPQTMASFGLICPWHTGQILCSFAIPCGMFSVFLSSDFFGQADSTPIYVEVNTFDVNSPK